MLFQEIGVRNAIAVHENEILRAGGENGSVEYPGFSEAVVLLP
jgi:hypothetical protein